VPVFFSALFCHYLRHYCSKISSPRAYFVFYPSMMDMNVLIAYQILLLSAEIVIDVKCLLWLQFSKAQKHLQNFKPGE